MKVMCGWGIQFTEHCYIFRSYTVCFYCVAFTSCSSAFIFIAIFWTCGEGILCNFVVAWSAMTKKPVPIPIPIPMTWLELMNKINNNKNKPNHFKSPLGFLLFILKFWAPRVVCMWVLSPESPVNPGCPAPSTLSISSGDPYNGSLRAHFLLL